MLYILFMFLMLINPLFGWIDLDDLINDPPIVLSLRKFEFKEFPNAYNPSLVKLEDGFLFIFRYQPDREGHDFISEIGIVKLDTSLNPVSEPKLLNTRPLKSRTPSQAEDARIFSYRNRLFLIYNDNLDVIEPYHDRRDMYVCELLETNGSYSLSLPLKLRYDAVYNYVYWQKNWVPFQYDDKLFLIYSMHPHLILEANLFTGTCYHAYETLSSFEWNYGKLRGSSEAMLVDGEYLVFFHSGIPEASTASLGWQLWHYFMGAYTFSATPPFKMTKITPSPVVAQGFYTPSHREKRVIFPGGFATCDNLIHVAYGKDDYEMWIATLDKKALLQAMKPVD